MRTNLDKIQVGVGLVGAVASIVLALTSLMFKAEIKWNTPEYILAFVAVALGALLTSFIAVRIKRKNKRVFLIYSHKDKDRVRKIYEILKENKFDVLFDEEVIKVGDSINEALIKNIEKADKLVLVLSQNTLQSKWTMSELQKALDAGKNILPLMIEDTEIPQQIAHIKYADFRTIEKEDVKELIEVLNKN